MELGQRNLANRQGRAPGRVEAGAVGREDGRKHRVSWKGKVNNYEEGYETVRRPRPRTLGQYMPEIFAVEAERPGNSEDKEASKKF